MLGPSSLKGKIVSANAGTVTHRRFVASTHHPVPRLKHANHAALWDSRHLHKAQQSATTWAGHCLFLFSKPTTVSLQCHQSASVFQRTGHLDEGGTSKCCFSSLQTFPCHGKSRQLFLFEVWYIADCHILPM